MVLSGPMPGSTAIPVTLEIPAQTTRNYVVIPIDSTSGLPDSLVPYKLQGNIRIAGKTVTNSNTLNVYPPAVVKLAADARIEVDGTLCAEGTTEYPIQFVSVASSPAAGDWDWIKIVGGGEANFRHCVFKHGYKAVWAYAHTTTAADYDDSSLTVTVNNCVFDSMSVAGIEVLAVPTSDLTIDSCTIDRCGSYGIRVRAGTPTIYKNEFGPPGNSSWYSCAVGGNADWIAAPTIGHNTFDEISSGWAMYFDAVDSCDTFLCFMQENIINAEENSVSFGGIMIYGCDDDIEFWRNELANDSSGGYGYLIYNSRPWIRGFTPWYSSGYADSRINGWKYGIGAVGAAPGDYGYPRVRNSQFDDNEYHVYVFSQTGSNCHLGSSPSNPGHNIFEAQSCSTYTVYNASFNTVPAYANCWKSWSDSTCWRYTYGSVQRWNTDWCPSSPPQEKMAEVHEIPREFSLAQNHPNPFNLATNIQFALPEARHVKIGIYNILGQRIRDVIDREYPPGIYTVPWNGKDNHGTAVGTGVYFYRIEAGNYVDTKKMVIVK